MTRNPHVIPLITLVAAFIVATGAALFMSVQSAHAEVSGPCVASIAGVDVAGVDSGNRDDDIHVDEHAQVVVGAVSPVGFESHKIQLEFAGRRWTVSEEDDNGSNSWTGTVNVDDYASVGLYKVVGVSTLSDGTTCTGAAMVDVGGNPLTTLVGAGAAVLAAVGTVGALATTTVAATRSRGPLSAFDDFENTLMRDLETVDLSDEEPPSEQAAEEVDGGEDGGEEVSRLPNESRREAEARHNIEDFLWTGTGFSCLCFAALAVVMMPLMALTGGGAGAPSGGEQPPTSGAEKPRRLPRAPWRPRITLLGLVSGFLAGAGIVVLLQQYSIQYPTLGAIITWVLIGTLVYGIVLPTLGFTVGWLRINARISRLEKEIQ